MTNLTLSTEKSGRRGIDQSWSTEQIKSYVADLPIWFGTPVLEPLIGGLCNTSFKVTDFPASYAARIGFDVEIHGIYQSSVQASAEAASLLGLTPEVIYVEPSLIVAEFAGGGTLKPQDLADFENLKKIVQVLKSLHINSAALKPAATYFCPFQVVRRYAEIGRKKNSRLKDKLPGLVQICNQLEGLVDPFVPAFTHNDVVPQNMVFSDHGDVLLVDWDYGGFGHPNFDLAGITINADCPKEFDDEVIRLYYGDCTPTHRRQYYIYKLMVALREHLWGMTQEVSSQLPDELVSAAMTSLYADQKAGYEGYTDLNGERFDRLWAEASSQLT